MDLPPELAVGTLTIVRDLAREVGERMVALAGSLRSASAKGAVDVVTEADRYSEQALCSALARHFPSHRIAGEEGTRIGPADSPWTWHIDPLDGTANYARGIPYWSLSIGLAHHDRPVLGVVHGPLCGITVSGGAGLGAWSGDLPLPPATPAGEERTWIVATDWPWDLAERERSVRLLARLAPRIRQYKTFGSAALDLANLALGHLDAYAIPKIFPWDQAAGAAIAAALGYELRTWSGAPWDLAHNDIVACRPGMWPVLEMATAP